MAERPDRPVPRVLAISDRRTLAVDLDDWLRQAADDGVPAFQLREKDLDDAALLQRARRARALLGPAVTLVVNGRLDVALAAGADGVHLPAAGLPADLLRAAAARRGARILVGRSTHRLEEVAAAAAEGVDYVTFGPVWATPSKAPYGPPAGVEALARAAAVGVPVLALGGVTAERVPEVAAAGAHGVAAIGALRRAAPRRRLLEAVRRRLGPVG